MYYLCIFQQPDNSDLFKGHGPASPGGGRRAYELRYSEEGLVQVGSKAQRGGSKVSQHHDKVT